MRNRFRDLEAEVINWAKEKEIFEKGNPLAQAEKGIEEAQEFREAVFADVNNLKFYNDRKLNLCDTKQQIKAELGDRFTTLLISAKFADLDVLECLQETLVKISDRKGTMVHGSFVKN